MLELLSDKRSTYESFMASVIVDDWDSEVRNFLKKDFYNSPIGDTMPLVIASVLCANVIIFPRNPTSYS